MKKLRKIVKIRNKLGLHARPAALFVQTANKFDSIITVEKDNEKVNGKSIMGVLMLGAEQGSSVIIEAQGQDAEIALSELEKLLSEVESDVKT
ncbi:MAG: HPr family phosphocarrier protein [Candidatus Omnitrophota bacterium]